MKITVFKNNQLYDLKTDSILILGYPIFYLNPGLILI